MSTNKIKVLYIAGYSRSGSTIFEQVLGELKHFFAVGELKYIWHDGFLKDYLCGCGVPIKSCHFWKKVAQDAFGAVEKVNWPHIVELRSRVDRMRYLPLLISGWQPKRFLARLTEYSDLLEKLYGAIQNVSNSKVIIDSSKYPPGVRILQRLPNIDLHVVHLVRDSRAVAYSWRRKKVKLEIPGEKTFMRQYNPIKTAAWWMLYNSQVELLGRRVPKYLRIRYEDFVNDPEATLSEVLSLVKENVASPAFISERKVNLSPNHGVAGNPVRFNNGIIELRTDNEWRSNMNGFEMHLATIISSPLLLKYGYL